MGRPKKYQVLDIYAPQKAYFKTEKGQEAIERYEKSEARKINKRDWYRKRNGTIVDKRQWFIDTYGDIDLALAKLNSLERASIALYYGLYGDKPLTQAAIGEKLGKSRPTISKIKKAAIAKLNAFKETVNSSK